MKGRLVLLSTSSLMLASWAWSDKAILALIRGTFPDKDALVRMYNQYTPSDGACNRAMDIGISFPGRSALTWVDQLQGIESPGGKQTVYFSLNDIQNNVEIDRSQGIEWIFYDLEGGLSPPQEVNDPINAINTAAQIVHAAGLKFAFTVVNVGRHPREIIPYVVANAEGYNPQGQNFFSQGCSVYANAVGEVIVLAKQYNPNLLVWAQGSLLRGSGETNQQCIQMLEEYLQQRGYRLDGVTIFYDNDVSQVPLLDQFYAWYSLRYRIQGDLNSDGCVNDADLQQVLLDFGSRGSSSDVNCDGVVNDADLAVVLLNFGRGC